MGLFLAHFLLTPLGLLVLGVVAPFVFAAFCVVARLGPVMEGSGCPRRRWRSSSRATRPAGGRVLCSGPRGAEHRWAISVALFVNGGRCMPGRRLGSLLCACSSWSLCTGCPVNVFV